MLETAWAVLQPVEEVVDSLNALTTSLAPVRLSCFLGQLVFLSLDDCLSSEEGLKVNVLAVNAQRLTHKRISSSNALNQYF